MSTHVCEAFVFAPIPDQLQTGLLDLNHILSLNALVLQLVPAPHIRQSRLAANSFIESRLLRLRAVLAGLRKRRTRFAVKPHRRLLLSSRTPLLVCLLGNSLQACVSCFRCGIVCGECSHIRRALARPTFRNALKNSTQFVVHRSVYRRWWRCLDISLRLVWLLMLSNWSKGNSFVVILWGRWIQSD